MGVSVKNDQSSDASREDQFCFTFPQLVEKFKVVTVEHLTKKVTIVNCPLATVTFRFLPDRFEMYSENSKLATFVRSKRNENVLIQNTTTNSIFLTKFDPVQCPGHEDKFIAFAIQSNMPSILEQTFRILLCKYCRPSFQQSTVWSDYEQTELECPQFEPLYPFKIVLSSPAVYESFRNLWDLQDVDYEIVFCFIDFNYLALQKDLFEKLIIPSNHQQIDQKSFSDWKFKDFLEFGKMAFHQIETILDAVPFKHPWKGYLQIIASVLGRVCKHLK